MRLIDADELKQQFIDKLVRVGLPSEKAEEFAKTAFDAIFKIIDAMPTIEVEPFTDKEQRIFLAAMAREEKVCKEVDEECRDCREPYEDSLVKTCHEITRKVKSVLWT